MSLVLVGFVFSHFFIWFGLFYFFLFLSSVCMLIWFVLFFTRLFFRRLRLWWTFHAHKPYAHIVIMIIVASLHSLISWKNDEKSWLIELPRNRNPIESKWQVFVCDVQMCVRMCLTTPKLWYNEETHTQHKKKNIRQYDFTQHHTFYKQPSQMKKSTDKTQNNSVKFRSLVVSLHRISGCFFISHAKWIGHKSLFLLSNWFR